VFAEDDERGEGSEAVRRELVASSTRQADHEALGAEFAQIVRPGVVVVLLDAGDNWSWPAWETIGPRKRSGSHDSRSQRRLHSLAALHSRLP
jgi:hypothetical protein